MANDAVEKVIKEMKKSKEKGTKTSTKVESNEKETKIVNKVIHVNFDKPTVFIPTTSVNTGITSGTYATAGQLLLTPNVIHEVPIKPKVNPNKATFTNTNPNVEFVAIKESTILVKPAKPNVWLADNERLGIVHEIVE